MRAPARTLGFSTCAIHHGYDPLEHQGALVPPIYHTSTFAFPGVDNGAQRFAGEAAGYIYTRISNPTLDLLASRIAALEGAEAGLVFGSGMGAITGSLWTLLAPGDEIIVDTTLYGCTFSFLHHGLAKFGIGVKHVDLTHPENLAAALSPRTRVVYFETPANPNMRLVDIAATSALAHEAGALVVVDNTYCSPYLQRPIEFGADLVVHSVTKYLSGHGDVTAGALVGPRDIVDRVRMYGLKDMNGAVLSPMDAHLVLRGMKTLALRLERHCANAQAMAELLEAHPAVSVVHYPGLASFPQRALAQRQMRLPGGMIAFEMSAGMAAGKAFIDALELVTCAVSLGDAESLVQHPASMTHSTYTEAERLAHGITPGLIRLSAGLEDIDDLLADLRHALAAASSVTR